MRSGIVIILVFFIDIYQNLINLFLRYLDSNEITEISESVKKFVFLEKL